MRYGITICVIGRPPLFEITESKFASVRKAKETLMSLLAIEEKFDALLENYVEFERELIAVSLNYMTHPGSLTWSSSVGETFGINRRLANLLAMARLYSDQVKHDTKIVLGNEGNAIRDHFSAEYDGHFEYRFMETLRNHVQHHGLPISGMSYHSSWQERNGQPSGVLLFSIRLHLDLDQIRRNPKVNAGVFAEIDKLGTTPDITLAARKYVEAFSRIHEGVRKTLAETAAEARALFHETLETARPHLGDRRAVDVVAEDEQERITEQIVINKELVDRIDAMQARNRSLPSLSKCYVSSEVSQLPPGNHKTS